MSKIKESAKLYARNGVSVFPCLHDKSPAVARGFHSATSDETKIDSMFNGHPMIGVPTGEIICLDIDAKHKKGLVADFEFCCHQLGAGDLLEKLPKQLTPSGGGAHFLFRSSLQIRNTKLASNSKRETIIETRGKGGYICVFPSKGYKFERSGLLDVPTITEEEVETLFEIARSFSEVEIKKKREPVATPWGGKKSVGTKPGNDYNERGDLPSLLQKHGWTTKTGNHWTRPGKSSGVSATLGKVESGNFYVFSSNAHPFEPDTSYTPFAVYATLEHGGKFSEAGKALREEGYGSSEGVEEVDDKMKACIVELIRKHDESYKSMESELAESKEELEAVKNMSVLQILKLRDISKKEKLEERKKQAKDMVFVLPGIAARGQATAIYAGPNSGKTLISLHLINEQAEAGNLGDLTVVYCNFDDDFRSANMKAEYMSKHDQVVVIDNQEQNAEDVLKMMASSIEDGTASSLCFVLDTLIRFVSDSDKKEQRRFTSLVQKFVGAQGTIIGLGHTNKHRDGNGKAIYGGTSDIRNSFSQSAILDVVTAEDTNDRRVKFYNDKLRGMAQVSTCYAYDHGDGKDWIERVKTVRRVDEKETNKMASQFLASQQLKEDQTVIDYILSELERGPQSITDIRSNNLDNSETGSASKRVEVLDRYMEGNNEMGYEFWGKSKAQTRGWNIYRLDETSSMF